MYTFVSNFRKNKYERNPHLRECKMRSNSHKTYNYARYCTKLSDLTDIQTIIHLTRRQCYSVVNL